MDIEVLHNIDLKDFSYFKIGGKVENLYFPKSIDEVIFLLMDLDNPLIFGGFSNVLFSSVGVKQDLICTSKFDKFDINDSYVKASAGVRGAVLSRACMEKSLTGFEFMSGFPGTIGGNIYMNASAHKQSISDTLLKVKVFNTSKKEVVELLKNDLNFGYRSSVFQEKPYILLEAEFELSVDKKENISNRIKENREFRKTHQPQNIPNVGSIFRNPENNSAGKILDEVGAKLLKVGGAKVFENHANFIVNYDNATSCDVLELMFVMYNKVKENFGIELKPEVKYFGDMSEREREICKILFQR